MKTCLRTLILAGTTSIFSLPGQAQDAFNPYSIFTMPPLAPDTTLAIPLGYSEHRKKTHYSVLVRVRLPGDTIFHAIPGLLPTGDSFGFRLKSGYRRQCDTLYVTRRGGVLALQLAEILILTFHKSDRLLSARHERDFTKAVLASYYDARTKRSAWDDANSESLTWKIPVQPTTMDFSMPPRARRISHTQ